MDAKELAALIDKTIADRDAEWAAAFREAIERLREEMLKPSLIVPCQPDGVAASLRSIHRSAEASIAGLKNLYSALWGRPTPLPRQWMEETPPPDRTPP